MPRPKRGNNQRARRRKWHGRQLLTKLKALAFPHSTPVRLVRRMQLTDEKIDTFLKANNHGRPMNEDLPYIWVGKDAAATYSKWPRDTWHLDIKARTFGRKRIVAKKPTEKAKLEGF